MSDDKPLPDPNNPLNAPFWTGLREHKLTVQRCQQCRALRFPAATLCPECLTPGGEWTEIQAEGELWSYVVYHRALAAPFAADIPYAVGLVEVEDRLQILSRIDAPLDAIKIGSRMRAHYVAVTDDVTLLTWAPIEPAESSLNG